MKNFITKKLREGYNQIKLHENISVNKNGLTELCNTMSVATENDVISLLTKTFGTKEQNPKAWGMVQKPLKNLDDENNQINGEIKNNHMSGDSMVDESNTWWAAIQSTFCK
jgi:plasmid maintenance system antidote protein VapI